MRSGLFGEDGGKTEFCMGWVRSYNPDTNIYRIALDGKSEGVARPITTGAYKPYPVGKGRSGTRVACVRFPTSGWLILGEVATSKAPTKERESPSNAVYKKDLELRRAIHDRYGIDLADFGDNIIDPPLEGDVVMQNRDDPRSYHQIYENGDILSLASNFCFSLLSRVKSLTVRWAKDCWDVFAGYSFKVTTDDTTKQATTEVSINSDPSDEADRDVELVAGAISNSQRPTKNKSFETKGKTIAEGLWALLGTHALLEVDNQAKEVRLSKVKIQAGKDVSVEDGQFRMNEKQIGFLWGDNKVTLNDDLTAIQREQHSIVIDDNQLALTWSADKYIVISDKGVKISGMLDMTPGTFKVATIPGIATPTVVDGEPLLVGQGTDGIPNLRFDAVGEALQFTAIGGATAISFNTDFLVRNFALLNEEFLTKYNYDIGMQLKQHQHISAQSGSPTTAFPGTVFPAPFTPGSLMALDDPVATNDDLKKLYTTKTSE
jgi:hypothetical protein